MSQSVTLPEANPTFTKGDDDIFYISVTASTQVSASAVKAAIIQHQSVINQHLDSLAQAAKAGVTGAATAITDLQAMNINTDPAAATPSIISTPPTSESAG